LTGLFARERVRATIVETHGSESYFVIGEGLLSESGDGRARTIAAAATAPPFRFSRMGPRGAAIGDANRRKVATAMTAGGGGSSDIPAGFTYLGQFVDHDLTFDKTAVMLGQNVSPAQLLQARSPSLDLDSLYGAGPSEPESAKFYSDDRHLKMGTTVAIDPDPAFDGHDLPRGAGTTQAQKRRAIIPDKRNDENLAVAQTHLAFIRFHNRIVDTLPSSVPAAQRFATARELAVKHYQWMLRHDYLPRICDPSVVDDVFTNGRKAFEVGANPLDVPTMPIEFSVAGFRLGHSMIRRDYNWNKRFPGDAGALFFLFDFSATSGSLGGFPRLPSNWIADFRRLYDFKGEAGKDNLAAPGGLNRAMRIDTLLVNPLRLLPRGSFGGTAADEGTIRANLAFRNLTRAKMVKLATGQKMVAFLSGKGVSVTALTKPQIRNGDHGARLDGLTQRQRDGVLKNTPLWFYVLREAELGGGRLGGVGARIVSETFHRAMEGSQHSIVRDPTWRPTFGPDSTTFRMVDLMLFAFEGKKKLLAPLG
jgi:Animal haem peroxidase